ncbi:MAG TPA: serpin family protein [Bellilinea sp.]|nr:serpin family protein [Bellilinea sp.]
MSLFRKVLLAVVVLALAGAGCAPQPATSEPTPTGETPLAPENTPEPVFPTPTAGDQPVKLQSDKPRETPPQSAYDAIGTLSTGNNEFALELYQQLRSQSGNLFYSPFSISQALAMTYAGAKGETETQMASTLHFDLAQADLHAAFNALSATLASRVGDSDQGGFELNIANALWGQQGFGFQPDFLDTLALHYGAGMQAVDFAASDAARQTINDWVAEQTKDKIQDLIPEGVLNELTRLVLTNAIYFKAAWLLPFEESATQNDTFDLLDGSEIQVPMMRQVESFGYLKAEDFEAVELFYEGRELSMVILLPDEDQFAAFEQNLNAATLQSFIDQLAVERLDLSLPKFKVESSFGLAETLAAMGMPDAFDVVNADFSGMTGQPDLFITDVVHKAFVDVNEIGTEAAAATGVVMGLKSMPTGEPIEVKIDRPFLFVIRDVQTGAMLFFGRVVEP